MNDKSEPSVQDTLSLVFQSVQMLGNAFLQLTARFDALQAIIGELHPEAKDRLVERIRLEQTETSKQFAELGKILELFHSTAPGKPQ